VSPTFFLPGMDPMSRRSLLLLAALMASAAPVVAQAQQARPEARHQMPAARGPLANPAQFLLSQTSTLELTDQQVLQLAELARAADARREALRADLQAARPAQPPESNTDRSALRTRLQAAREEYRSTLERERVAAIALLTPEQQARAWELLARAGTRGAAAMRPRPDVGRSPGMRGRMAPPRGERPLPPEER
jgi:hypothetical protein